MTDALRGGLRLLAGRLRAGGRAPRAGGRTLLAGGLALLGGVGVAPAAEPDAFDPILDVAPRSGGAGQRLRDPDPRAPGLAVAAFGGLYTGQNRSYLTTELSTLEGGNSLLLGFGIGYRTASPFEVVFDFALAFGETWSPPEDKYLDATDLLIQPKVIFHGLEWAQGGLYLGAGGHVALFDVETAGLNQAGLGPLVLLGAQRRLGHNLLVYLELAYSPIFDVLAYRYEDPTEEDLAEDPTAPRIKVTGAWFHVGLINLGFRLTAL